MKFKQLFLILLSALPIFNNAYSNSITIRKAEQHEMEAVTQLRIDVFTEAYQATEQAAIDLEKSFRAAALEEEKIKDGVTLVALNENKIIGAFLANPTDSRDEWYARCIVIASQFQEQKITNKILLEFLILYPNIKRIVCLTKKTNSSAQELYRHFGGKEVENPSWACFLHKDAKIQDYLGYEFDESTILTFKTMYASQKA